MEVNTTESEAQCLAVLLVHPERLVESLDVLYPEDFRIPHDKIYRAITALHKANTPIDQLTVSQWLRNHGQLDECGGRQYLYDLTQAFCTEAAFPYHVQKVKDASRLRATYRLFDETVAQDESGAEPAVVVARIAEKLQALSIDKAGKVLRPACDTLGPLMDNIAARDGKGIPGLSTGLYELDQILLGLVPGRLITIAGRPGMGKSALVGLIAESVAVDQNEPVAVFSLEMSKEDFLERMLSGRSRTSGDRMKLGMLQENDKKYLAVAAEEISKAPLYVVDQADGFSALLDFEAGLARLRSKDIYPKVVIIDYIQIVETEKEAATRDLEISRLTRRVKKLAQQFGFTAIILSQLSRAVEARKDKRPMLSDLRESGGIEGDSDQVLFVYRDEYYNPETERRGEAEIIVGKNRHGAEGVVNALWQGSITRFLNKVNINSPNVVETKARPLVPPEPVSPFSIVEKDGSVYVVAKDISRPPVKLWSRESWLKRLTKLAAEDEGTQSTWWLKRYAELDEEPDKMANFVATLNLRGAEEAWEEVQARPKRAGLLERVKQAAHGSSENTEPSR